MLFSTTTPEAKRIALREMLAGPRTVRFPGAFTPLSTKLIQEQGFDGVYISGAVPTSSASPTSGSPPCPRWPPGPGRSPG